MRRIIAAAALLLILVTPSFASWHEETPQELARWAGCNAEVVVSDQHSIFESFYNGTLYIGTQPGEPDYVYHMIILHEIAHCLQDQALGGAIGAVYGWDPQTFELDADMQAANMACRRGEDGPRLANLLLDKAHEEFNYNGDEGHGTLDMRREAANRAPACQKDIQGA